MKFIKLLIKRENILFLLVLALVGLNYSLKRTLDDTNREIEILSEMVENVEDEVDSYLYEIYDNSRDAKLYAIEAADYAAMASDNAFANVCNYCPSGY